MTLRLVRCPKCRQRFNAAGADSGTQIQCAFCAASLRVPVRTQKQSEPRNILPRKPILQIGLAAGIGFVLALGAFFLLRPSTPVQPDDLLAGNNPLVEEAEKSEKSRITRHFEMFPRWSDGLEQAKQDLYREFEGKHLSVKAEYPFLIAVEAGPRFMETDLFDDYAHRLSMLYEVFKKEFAAPLSLAAVDRVLPVVILNSRESYDEYCRSVHGSKMPSQITGLYEYSKSRTVMYHDAWAPYEVVFHEGTHQLVHHYTKQKKRTAIHSYWFQEGMGTYFEGFTRRQGEIVLDPQANRNRLPTVLAALKDGASPSFIPVDKLAKMSIDDFWDWFDARRDDEMRAKLAQLYYAESWALVHFMLHGENGRYRKAFLRYFKSELDGRGTNVIFERAVREETGVDLATFQKNFVDYITHLK